MADGTVVYTGIANDDGSYPAGATVAVTCDAGYAGGGTFTCMDGGSGNGGAWSLSTTLPTCAGEACRNILFLHWWTSVFTYFKC